MKAVRQPKEVKSNKSKTTASPSNFLFLLTYAHNYIFLQDSWWWFSLGYFQYYLWKNALTFLQHLGGTAATFAPCSHPVTVSQIYGSNTATILLKAVCCPLIYIPTEK